MQAVPVENLLMHATVSLFAHDIADGRQLTGIEMTLSNSVLLLVGCLTMISVPRGHSVGL
jgi:hypothetical protein